MSIYSIWFWNSIVESGAGLVAFIAPDLLFPGNSKAPDDVRKAARWWASAVLGIGAGSFLLRNVPDYDVGKHIAGFIFLIYHVLLAILHIPTSSGRGRGRLYVEKKLAGAAVHVCFAAMFALYLNRVGFWPRVVQLLE